MAFSSNLTIITLFLVTSSFFSISNARQLGSYSTLLARLKLDQAGSSNNCWGSLFELQSCTGEIILFFLNGETYLGPGCCRAIRTIEHECWPTLLGSLGYTSEEGDILQGYCDASGDTVPPHAASAAAAAGGAYHLVP
ncbi:hypothetical protein LguiA_003876 [Lonicera macranthoides]